MRADVTEAPTEAPRRGRRSGRRALAIGGAVAVGCALIWTLSGALLDGGGSHGGRDVEELDVAVEAGEDGVRDALGDLHGHLNWVLWSDGELDEDTWLQKLTATVAELEAQGHDAVAADLRHAGDALERHGDTDAAHDIVAGVEYRYAATRRDE